MNTAIEYKNKGNEFFKEGKYEEAIEQYTKAIEANNKEPSFYSNRSGAYFNLNKYEEALNDAEQCI